MHELRLLNPDVGVLDDLSPQEREVLRELCMNADLIVKTTDKGGPILCLWIGLNI